MHERAKRQQGLDLATTKQPQTVSTVGSRLADLQFLDSFVRLCKEAHVPLELVILVLPVLFPQMHVSLCDLLRFACM